MTRLIKHIYHSINERLFLLKGMVPWSRGYAEYKTRNIKQALANNPFHYISFPSNYGFRLDERIVEYPWFFSRLPEDSFGKLLDAGSVLNFDFILNHKSMKNKNIFISTLAPESNCFWNDGISYVYEDLRESCFKDKYFNWIVSLSTVEHIGLDNTFLYTGDSAKHEDNKFSYLGAISELKRILKDDGKLYLSFPFGRYKNHGWFQVFDAPMVDKLIEKFSPSSFKEFYFKYEPTGWCVSTRDDSSEATYFDIHSKKIFDEDFAAASRAIVCLEMTK